MGKRGEGSRDNECGAAAVEFALIVPLLLLLVTGMIEFSLAFNRQQGLHAAAREGARMASIPSATQDDISDAVDRTLIGVSLTNPVTVTVVPNDTKPCATADSVTVTVSTQSSIGVVGAGVASITQQGRGEFACEN